MKSCLQLTETSVDNEGMPITHDDSSTNEKLTNLEMLSDSVDVDTIVNTIINENYQEMIVNQEHAETIVSETKDTIEDIEIEQ